MTGDQRTILLYAEDVNTADDLRQLLAMVTSPPLKPTPPGGRYGDPQEPWPQEEVDAAMVELLKRSAPKITWGAVVITP